MTPADASEHRDEFCARLKHEREHRGVSLTYIADHTKIKASLLAALEQGDLSRWPKGIYRRAFFRDYATAVGLPLETYMSEFLRLFGERDQTAELDHPPAPSAAPKLALPLASMAPALSFRLTFGDASIARRAMTPAAGAASATIRLATALTDVALVLAIALGLSRLSSWDVWHIVSIVAMADLALTVFTTQSPAAWLFRRVGASGSDRPLSAAATADWAGRLRALSTQASRTMHTVREYAERFAYGASMTARSQRRRDIMGMRRRRVEAANASVDEAGMV